MKRGHITLKTKLAAAIGALFLTYDERRLLSEDQVLSLVNWDHDPIPHAEDGTDDHFNLVPLLIGGHRAKTATVDVPGIAKRKRVSQAHAEFRTLILTPRDQRPECKSSFPKGRKMQSRNSNFRKKEKR